MKKTLLPRLRLSPVLARRVIASAAGAFASVACVLASAACASRGAEPSEIAVTASRLTGDEMLAPVKNDEGKAQTATSTGALDTGNPFFQSLGTNGRSCGSCHVASEGWSITPAGLRARFEATGGLDPVFLRLDGADSPVAPDETIDDRRANARNLLRRGTIRVGLPATRAVATWDIDIEVLADPSNANALTATNGQVSFFRRPLPTTNLRFLAAVNWDGRNTPDPNDMRPGLLAQANGATVNHAQGAALDAATRAAIVDFETSLVTAQVSTWDAGRLDAVGASGGPVPLLGQTFTLGLSSAPRVFDLYDAWTSRRDDGEDRAKVARRRGLIPGRGCSRRAAGATRWRTSAAGRASRSSTSASATRAAGTGRCRSTASGRGRTRRT